ncbi:MAG: ABC transporter ATP-binding protein [Thermomonas sp.]|uniref:ABC transporter ATP-binding protein n=1 Tax=Thermomonas sp. TaxID=1971895 RepID=UPI00260FA94E|nr:ABC transporter ATP-binding protein [Thermomonas sp.]MCC7096824.1 ABC transporter ATP-binding protein [Thermomonas sp.]
MSELQVSDLHIAYGKAEAVVGAALDAGQGEIVSIIGANGAGKSTLLGAIMGILPIRSGTIRFDGEDIARLDVEERLERGLCLVPEKRELFGELSVLQNLQLGGYSRRSSSKAAMKRSFDQAIDLFPRLGERLDQRADTLSGGERQMLALGRALMAAPRMLMLDEPSLGIAPIVNAQIFAAISKLGQSGVSVLLVEQNARAALRISQRGYVIEGGCIVLEGTAQSLASNDAVLRSYLGLSGSADASRDQQRERA